MYKFRKNKDTNVKKGLCLGWREYQNVLQEHVHMQLCLGLRGPQSLAHCVHLLYGFRLTKRDNYFQVSFGLF